MSVPAMSVEDVAQKASSFCKSFAQALAQLISEFPKEYWAFFPRYMTSPFRLKVFVAANGVAVRFVRPSRRLRVTVSPQRGNLETAIFPRLGGGRAMFILRDTQGSSVSHLTLADTEVADIGPNVEFSFEDVRYAWKVSGQDRVVYEYLLWIFSPPATAKLGSEFGYKQAASKFGGFLSWVIFDTDNPKSYELDYARFLLAAARILERQFANLIVRSDVEEEELQEFLCDHRAILTSSLGYQSAQCKFRLSAHDIVDFLLTVGRPPSKSQAVEIEPSHYEVVTPTAGESPRLRGAIAQVRRYIKALAEQDNDLANSEIAGLVIIGRSSAMEENSRKSLVGLNQSLAQERIRIITFDELLLTLESRRRELEKRVVELSKTS